MSVKTLSNFIRLAITFEIEITSENLKKFNRLESKESK